MCQLYMSNISSLPSNGDNLTETGSLFLTPTLNNIQSSGPSHSFCINSNADNPLVLVPLSLLTLNNAKTSQELIENSSHQIQQKSRDIMSPAVTSTDDSSENTPVDQTNFSKHLFLIILGSF